MAEPQEREQAGDARRPGSADADAALRACEERLRIVQQVTHDVIWEWEVARDRLIWSEAAYSVFRYPPETDAQSTVWWEGHIHPDDRERVVSGFRSALVHGEHWVDEYRFERGDGTYAHIIDRAYVLRDAAGRAVRLIGAMQDVTEQAALEAELRQAQRMEAVGRLAGGVAHDFNNLLMVISAGTTFARAELHPRSPAAVELDAVEQAAQRAAELTRQLLAFSRKQVLQPQRVNVNRTVESVQRMLRRLIRADVRVETRLASAPWPVYADPGQLEQVITNLVVNARDAMPEGGTIRITTANVQVDDAMARAHPGLASGAYVSLAFADTGVGIPEELLPHVFEPFVTTKEPGQGTGLGLATVYGIVKQSGGHVFVDSTRGRGTTFTVLLPREEEPATERDGAAAPPPVGGRETVLLVEDDAAVREVLRRLLTRVGYRVIQAANGEEALGIWRTHKEDTPAMGAPAGTGRIDLVLTDLVMPVLGGRMLLQRLRAEQPDARIILMTGYTADTAGVQAALAAREASAFLQKPVAPDELLRVVREVLEAP